MDYARANRFVEDSVAESTGPSADAVNSASDPPAKTTEALANASAETLKGIPSAAASTVHEPTNTPANRVKGPAVSSAEVVSTTPAANAGTIRAVGMSEEGVGHIEKQLSHMPVEAAIPTSAGNDSSHWVPLLASLLSAIAEFEGYYRLVRLSAVRKWTRWKRYQDLDPDEYVEYYPKRWSESAYEGTATDNTTEGEFEDPESHTNTNGEASVKEGGKRKRRLYFISHRWLDPMHPDPKGSQLRRIQRLGSSLPPPPTAVPYPSPSNTSGPSVSSALQPDGTEIRFLSTSEEDDVLIFYDYSSLPQSPRTRTEDLLFNLGIRGLNSLLARMRVIILEDPEYMSRSWCLMEYFIAAFHGCLVYDDVRDERLMEIQQRAVAPNQERIKSSTAEIEALRMGRIGELSSSFFAESFAGSTVTNRTDRQRIEEVFRDFIQLKIYAWAHETFVGWKPQPLSKEDVDRILRGEHVRLMLGAGGGTGLSPPAMPGPMGDMAIPHSFLANSDINLYDQANNTDLLDRYWGTLIGLRGLKAMVRYYWLNDGSVRQERSLIRAIAKAESCTESSDYESLQRTESDDRSQDDGRTSIPLAVGGQERGKEDGWLGRTAGGVDWKTKVLILSTANFIVWTWIAAVLIGWAVRRVWVTMRIVKRVSDN